MVTFDICTSYHPPVGRQKRGHNEYYFTSKCNRWTARQGNFGTMIVTDFVANKVHVVKGKMPKVHAFVASIAK